MRGVYGLGEFTVYGLQLRGLSVVVLGDKYTPLLCLLTNKEVYGLVGVNT